MTTPSPSAPPPGRVTLITGCTSGIGAAAARALAAQPGTLVLLGRSASKLEALSASLSGGPATVETLQAELGERAQVRRAAEALLARHPTLHLLINNAGVYNQQRKLTADGVEETFAVNHLAYFELTLRLLPALRAAGQTDAPARVINVASDAHRAGSMQWSDLERAQGYGQGWGAYAQSKLANILFTRALGRRLAGRGVVVHALHPGFVNSGFARNNGWLGNFAMSISRPFQRSPERAAQTITFLANSAEAGRSTGGYWANERPSTPTRAARDEAAEERLWAVSLERCGLTEPSFA